MSVCAHACVYVCCTRAFMLAVCAWVRMCMRVCSKLLHFLICHKSAKEVIGQHKLCRKNHTSTVTTILMTGITFRHNFILPFFRPRDIINYSSLKQCMFYNELLPMNPVHCVMCALTLYIWSKIMSTTVISVSEHTKEMGLSYCPLPLF